MNYRRANVGMKEFNQLSQIEKELLYTIHLNSDITGGKMSFDYIAATFKPKYPFGEITKALNKLREKGYLYQTSFYETTFGNLEYPEDMEGL
jgi:hypothetical protein